MSEDRSLEFYAQKSEYYRSKLKLSTYRDAEVFTLSSVGGADKSQRLTSERSTESLNLKTFDKLNKRSYSLSNCNFVKTLINSIEKRELYQNMILFLIEFVKAKTKMVPTKTETLDQAFQYIVSGFFNLCTLVQLFVFDLTYTELSQIPVKLEHYILAKQLSFKEGFDMCRTSMVSLGKEQKNSAIINAILTDNELMNCFNRVKDKFFEKEYSSYRPVLRTETDVKLLCRNMTLDELTYVMINFDISKNRFVSVSKRLFGEKYTEDELLFLRNYGARITLTQKNISNWPVDGVAYTDGQISYKSDTMMCHGVCSGKNVVLEEVSSKMTKQKQKTVSVQEKIDKLLLDQEKGRTKELYSGDILKMMVYITETREQYLYYLKTIQQYLVKYYQEVIKMDCNSILVPILSAYCILVAIVKKNSVNRVSGKIDTEKLNVPELLDCDLSVTANDSVKRNGTNTITQMNQQTFSETVKKLIDLYVDLPKLIESNIKDYDNADLSIFGFGPDVTPTYVNVIDQGFLSYFKTENFAEKCSGVLTEFDLQDKLDKNKMVLGKYAQVKTEFETTKQKLEEIEKEVTDLESKIREEFAQDSSLILENGGNVVEIRTKIKPRDQNTSTQSCGIIKNK